MGTEFLILSTTELYPIKVVKMRISLLVQWLRLFAPTAGAAGLILEQETKISHAEWRGQKKDQQARFSSMYTKIGRIERRLAWPLHKDDMQMPESFHVKKKKRKKRQRDEPSGFKVITKVLRDCPVAQWQITCLPMQETWVRSLIQGDSHILWSN